MIPKKLGTKNEKTVWKRKFEQEGAEPQRRKTGGFNGKRWRFIFFSRSMTPLRLCVLLFYLSFQNASYKKNAPENRGVFLNAVKTRTQTSRRTNPVTVKL